MAFDLEERLRQSNARFMASMNSILERYNQPFEDDLLISMETLTYDTPTGPKQWEEVSIEQLKKWNKKCFRGNRGSRRKAETLEQQTSDFEDGHSTVYQESPENSRVDRPDIDEESDAGVVSVRGKREDIDMQNLYGPYGKIQKKVKVDVIVQENARKIPKWIMKAPQGSSEDLHLASPMQELIGNQATVCSKRVELSNEYSSLRPLQPQFLGVPISPDTITISRHQLYPELNKICCDYVLGEYQSEGEECSCSNVTLADLYPAMVQVLKRVMTKQSLKNMFGHLRHKRWHSRRPKLNVTVDKIRGFRPLKMKQALPSICSSRREDFWNQTSGNENRELGDDSCSINDLSGLVPYSYPDTNEIKMDCSDSSLEHHLVSAKGPTVSKQTGFPNVMPRMGKTFLVEDKLETVSPKNSKCKENEKLAYGCSSEYRFIASSASSWSTTLHLVKGSNPQQAYFPCGPSVLCSSTCSSYGNSNMLTPVANSSLARTSNTLLINPEKITSGGQISFQCKDSFSSLSMNQSPSKMPQKYKDAFEELYYKLCSKEIQKPLTLTGFVSNSQKPEEKERLLESNLSATVKSNLSASVRSNTLYDRAFDSIYDQLCGEAVAKLPGFQKAANVRKYEGIKMSETVKALVNSPVRTIFHRVKRLGSFQGDHLCSPGKRLRSTPECYFPSVKCQQISHRKNINHQTMSMDFLSTYSGSNSSFLGGQNCRSQDSGFHASSNKTFLINPGTSLQGSRIAAACSGCPKGNEELTAVTKMLRSITKGYSGN